VRYEFERLVGKDRNGWRDKWTRYDIIDGVFMLYQSMREFLKAQVK
jgi:hypothetical protein